MIQPTDLNEIISTGAKALKYYKKNLQEDVNLWCYVSLDNVKKNLYSTKYHVDKLVFIEGDVLETVPSLIPQKIAFLRLGTDFYYASTKHELENLYPLLSLKRHYY